MVSKNIQRSLPARFSCPSVLALTKTDIDRWHLKNGPMRDGIFGEWRKRSRRPTRTSRLLTALTANAREDQGVTKTTSILSTLNISTAKMMAPLACSLLTVAAASSAFAHEDITYAILTERSANCADYVDTYSAKATDASDGRTYDAALEITVNDATCTLTSNAVPNHDFGIARGFPNPFSEQSQRYTITATPEFADAPTALSLQYDNAIFLNGVKLDLVAAGCYGVGNGRIGCNDMSSPYGYDPMSPAAGFNTDMHNAHTQPDGTYHYHGNPMALFVQENPTAPSPVIGFAADGFPIFGSYIADGGTIRKATTSYRLKSGTRDGGPGGEYDGTFADDWEYVAGSGDLDQCNGMVQDGVYGYVVTDSHPHVMGCFVGTPDRSFQKRRR